ncbi:MAG: hypothetical protein FWD89_02280 [Firmicutes bacterium]|nr:hypothetical protein [Bacillota bacterium]MCL2771118.1 hypothetical protein [Bacillota bacterium]
MTNDKIKLDLSNWSDEMLQDKIDSNETAIVRISPRIEKTKGYIKPIFKSVFKSAYDKSGYFPGQATAIFAASPWISYYNTKYDNYTGFASHVRTSETMSMGQKAAVSVAGGIASVAGGAVGIFGDAIFTTGLAIGEAANGICSLIMSPFAYLKNKKHRNAAIALSEEKAGLRTEIMDYQNELNKRANKKLSATRTGDAAEA